ncbi:MAG: metal-dependent hydrolase [Archaeoglobaceae archaeon]
MADWLTHILIGLIAIELLSFKYTLVKEQRALVLVSSILPDLGNFTMLMGELGSNLGPFFEAVHTPVGFLFLAGLVSYGFKREWVRAGFLLILLGGLLHIAADLLIVSLDGKVMLLFPFSLEKYSLNVFRQGEFAYLGIVFVLAIIVFSFVRLYRLR